MANEYSQVRPPDSSPTPAGGDALRVKPLVLVVDDFDDNRLLYATTIAEAGYTVDEAINGQEAIDKIGSKRPAIIIMDLSMPVLDGWEATRRIKADPRTADIIVIALTSHATNYGLQNAMDAGAHAVLTKPCLPQDLIGVIGALASSVR
jgi:two-component system, cell cycle response regulator DivK